MSTKSLSWFLLILLSIVWGSSFMLMKRGLEAFSSGEVAALRIGIAFLFLSPLLLWHYRIDLKKYLPGLLIMGFFGNFFPAFLFTHSETMISSSLAGMLNALTPFFTVLVAWVWLKLRPSGNKIAGIAVGFVAAIALIFFEQGNDTFKNFSFGGLALLATFFYALAINGIKKYLSDLNAVTATVWAFTFTGPVALIYLFGFSDFTQHLQHSPKALSSLGYVSILAIAGTALSVILFNVLIRISGVVFASSTTYLIPVVAVLWGIFGGELVSMGQIFGMVVIILSVYIINRR